MAKKIVRGITDVKTINNQDFDTNNVNDLLSDGQYNYIHRKKGKDEEYHNLTDNIKTISSDNTDLLTVTNNNKTTNTATLHPKHDAQKEQLLESTRNTVTINHGTNGTAEKTTVDTNPKKVLEHEKLKTGDGLTTSFNTDETTIMFKATKKPPETNLNTLGEGVIYGKGFSIDQVPGEVQDTSAAYVTINTSDNKKVQFYIREQGNDYGVIRLYYRFIINGEVTEWRKMPGDRSDLNYELAQKEQVLESQNNTITINHGTNGTDEKTTVNTNPEKVLEHENLISDSEYITLQHQTGENKTHIKTEALNQVLEQLYQAIGGGPRHTINYISSPDFSAVQHSVSSGYKNVVTFSFECYNVAETVLTGPLKQQLGLYVEANTSISNGTITISNDGTTMKLINSAPSETVRQHATFTFYYKYEPVEPGEPGGGGEFQPL